MTSHVTLSVVVPALNEAEFISGCITSLRGEHEILVVDGGSHDGTAACAEAAGARVLRAERGYAVQCNAGAAAARGDVLFFLAADSRPAPGWRVAIERALASPYVVAGGFHLTLADSAWPFRVIEWGGNFRARYLRLALPDQGLFVRREAFLAAGGFRAGSLIPNARLCVDLQPYGEFRLLPERVHSSARKWREHGIAAVTLAHMRAYLRYKSRELSR